MTGNGLVPSVQYPLGPDSAGHRRRQCADGSVAPPAPDGAEMVTAVGTKTNKPAP